MISSNLWNTSFVKYRYKIFVTKKYQIMIIHGTEFIQLSFFITFVRKDGDFKGQRLSWLGESFFNDLSQKLWEVKEF